MFVEESRAVLRSVKRAIYPLTSKVVTNTTLVEGPLKGSGEPLRVLFVHRCLFNSVLMARTFGTPPDEIRHQRIGIPSLRSMIRSRQGEFDLCVAVLPSLYDPMFGPLCTYQGQEEVRQVIDTSCTWDEVRLRFSKKKRQLTNHFAERYGLSYRISHAPEDFDFFYHRMHVPHIRRRYGELSELDSHATMFEFFKKGFVLFVTRDGQPVAGALSLVEGDTILFRRSGVLDGDESHVKGGAQTALYYFQLRHAVDSGYKAIDTMKSAPFLNDGVFCHKADWGAQALRDHEAQQSVFYFVPAPDARAVRFFELNPVVVCKGDGLTGVAGDPSLSDDPESGVQAISKRFQSSGLGHFTSLTLDSGGQVAVRHG